jgi:hypothetical protein
MKRKADKPNNKMIKRAFRDGRPIGWRPKDQKSGTHKHAKLKK